MFCHQCRAILPDNAKFCLQCGASIDESTRSEYQTNPYFTHQTQTIVSPKKGSNVLPVITILFVIFGVVVLAFIFIFIGVVIPNLPNKDNQKSSFEQPPIYQVPQKQRYVIVDKGFHIKAATYSWYEINLPSQAQGFGRFSAEGGGRNDIEVFIFDEDGFSNFKNGNTANTYYNSNGTKTVDNINVNLPPGKFYLVFRNPAIFYSKTVTAKFEVEY